MNVYYLDSLLAIVFYMLTAFLPKFSPKYKEHLNYLVGGTLNLYVLLVILVIISNRFPLAGLACMIFVFDSHMRVNLVEQFRTYFGMEKLECD